MSYSQHDNRKRSRGKKEERQLAKVQGMEGKSSVLHLFFHPQSVLWGPKNVVRGSGSLLPSIFNFWAAYMFNNNEILKTDSLYHVSKNYLRTSVKFVILKNFLH